MRWRCPAASQFHCALAHGHSGSHQALIVLGGRFEIISWDSIADAEPEPQVQPDFGMVIEQAPLTAKLWRLDPAEANVSVTAVSSPKRPRAYEPPPTRHEAGGGYQFSGRKRSRTHICNPYAGIDEGVHLSWNIQGHEILPLPTLDEVECLCSDSCSY